MGLPISDKAKETIQELVAEFPKPWKSGVCHFRAVHRETGELVNIGASQYCHAGLRGARDEHIIINAHRPEQWGLNKDFTLWVAREAPFNHGVVNKGNEEELLNHASVLDVNETGKGGVLWTCKAFRLNHEEPWRVIHWNKLMETGILNGFQAFVGASILNQYGEPYRGMTHCSLFGYDSPKNLRRTADEILGLRRIEDMNANRRGSSEGRNWGSMQGKTEKKPDGWGGFTEVFVAGGAKDYASQLKEILEGNPSNVK